MKRNRITRYLRYVAVNVLSLFMIHLSYGSEDYDAVLLLYQSGKYEDAIKYFKNDAEKGNDKSQYMLGSMYHLGKGVKVNVTSAEKWYRLSAEQENNKAQYVLGTLLLAGPNSNQLRKNEAIKWFERSAINGNEEAQYMLGRQYELGIDVKKDLDEARKWYMMAIAQGNKDAIVALEDIKEK